MKTNKLTIPHSEQRYDTVGDWWFEDDTLEIRVSDMGNADFEWFVGMHEEIEAYFCLKDGVDEKEVTKFDMRFEDMRTAFPDLVGDMEPGNHEHAPYNKQHLIASRIEKWLFDQMYGEKSNELWQEYDKKVNEL